MIQKATAYRTEDGTFHQTTEAAQTHEIAALIDGVVIDEIPGFIVTHRLQFMEILKLKERKSRAKKVAKGRKGKTGDGEKGGAE